jgi:hypothetical protein
MNGGCSRRGRVGATMIVRTPANIEAEGAAVTAPATVPGERRRGERLPTVSRPAPLGDDGLVTKPANHRRDVAKKIETRVWFRIYSSLSAARGDYDRAPFW